MGVGDIFGGKDEKMAAPMIFWQKDFGSEKDRVSVAF